MSVNHKLGNIQLPITIDSLQTSILFIIGSETIIFSLRASAIDREIRSRE
jgi:hypothetical protein